MLNKSSLITEAVTTVLSHTVEVRLVLPISTVAVAAVFIKTVNILTLILIDLNKYIHFKILS